MNPPVTRGGEGGADPMVSTESSYTRTAPISRFLASQTAWGPLRYALPKRTHGQGQSYRIEGRRCTFAVFLVGQYHIDPLRTAGAPNDGKRSEVQEPRMQSR